VLEGGPVTLPDGASAEFAPGMVQHFERGVVHAGVTNSGDAPIRLITVHIVDKGKPLNVSAELGRARGGIPTGRAKPHDPRKLAWHLCSGAPARVHAAYRSRR
jgi:hypothetical protein